MKDKKRKKVTISGFMTPIVMVLFLVVLLMLMNFQSFCHFCNRDIYEDVTATVTMETKDPLAMVVPMVEIQYEYQGATYTDKKYFLLQPLFGLSSEEGGELTVYVNKEAPGYSLFKENFFQNIWNWAILLCGGVFISLWIRNIRRGWGNRKERLRRKRDEKERRNGGRDEET